MYCTAAEARSIARMFLKICLFLTISGIALGLPLEDPTPRDFQRTPVPSAEPTPRGASNETDPTPRGDLLLNDVLSHEERSGTPSKANRWDGNTVPIEFDSKFTKDELNEIYAGLDLIRAKTCIKFIYADGNRDKNWVKIVRAGNNVGCNSYVGKMNWKAQILNLEASGCINKIIIAHEMIHAIGFHHEMVRPDRDSYINVIWENIDDRYSGGFKIKSDSLTFGVPYDYKSIMHYGSREGSKNGKPVMLNKQNQEVTMTNWQSLTDYDGQKINKMYNC